MTQQEEQQQLQEEMEALDLFAGIALPGIIARTSIFDDPRMIGQRAYEIAEVMVAIRKTKRDERNSRSNFK